MGNSTLADLSGLKRRLAAVFFAVAIVLIASGVVAHRQHQASLRAEAAKMLLSIEQIKLEQLQLWREDRANSALSLLDGHKIAGYLRALTADPSDKKAADGLRARLRTFIERNGYQFAAMAGLDGKLLFSTGGKPEKMCPGVTSLIAKAKASGLPQLGDFYLHPGETTPHIDIVAPAVRAAPVRDLYLLLRLDPANFLYPLLQAWSAKGATGEILLVGRDGDELVFLNDLRHVKDAAMRLRRPLTAEALPAAMGLRGKNGVVEGLDYRGVPVLAAVGPVPGTNWAMVTKLDRDEVMKGTGTLAVLLALLVLSLLVAIGSVAFVLFRGQVEKAEEMLARLTDQVPGVVYQYRLYPDGRSCFPYASSGMEMIYEVTPEEVREDATPVFGRLHPDDLKSTGEAIAASGRDLSIFHLEFRVVLPKQGLRWRLCDARPERLPDGGTLWHGIITDITDRKLAEEALRKSENAVRNKLNAIMSPEGDIGSIPLEDIFDIPALQRMMDDMYQLTRITSAILDINGKVLVASGWQDICTKFHRVNPETCRHCLESDTILSRDIPPGEVRSYFCKNNMRDVATPLIVGGAHVGNFFLGQFLYEDDPRDIEKVREQARRYGFDEEEYLAAYDRIPVFSRRNVEVLISFYRQVSELISTLSYGKIKLARALAQSRQAELEKENLNKALAAKNKEMENFLYITTHDLRSPLVNIQGFSQNIQRDLAEIRAALAEAGLPEARKERTQKLSEEKVPEALGFVLESSAKMDMLLSALLKVSRLGRQELKPEPLEMGAMLARLVDTMIFQVREAGAEIKIGPLPLCRADAASVSQLFSNLLDNAVKYRDPARKLVVEISGETRGGRAVYRVADNGPGIAAADLERLWDVFYKPARAGKKSGEGIGLPMCRRIAERNSGGIRVEANPGGGSVFVVELPSAQGTEGT